MHRPDGSYTAPNGFFTRLVRNGDGSYAEREAMGTVYSYRAAGGTGIAALTSITDRNTNTMRFQYNAQGQLVRVIDTLNRPIDYLYNEVSLLREVRDFAGRSLCFSYDGNGELAAVTSPAVTGTPTRNDFPNGKTEVYTYSAGFFAERLNHNLLTITAPNEVAAGGPPRLVLTYNNDPASPNADRVLTQTLGGTNASNVPAGGTMNYSYLVLGSAPPGDFVTPVFQTTVTDRNGNFIAYQFNQLGPVGAIPAHHP